MPARKRAAKSAKKKDSTAHLGFEAKIWLVADNVRINMDTAVYFIGCRVVMSSGEGVS